MPLKEKRLRPWKQPINVTELTKYSGLCLWLDQSNPFQEVPLINAMTTRNQVR